MHVLLPIISAVNTVSFFISICIKRSILFFGYHSRLSTMMYDNRINQREDQSTSDPKSEG